MAKDNSWAYNLEKKIFTIVKARVVPQISSKFSTYNFTMTDMGSTTTTTFPTVYIHQNGGIETPVSIENDMIESVNLTMQIDVMTNTTQTDANYVMAKVCDVMKDLGFTIVSMPTFNNLTEVYRSTARFRRYVDSTDSF